MNRTCTWAMAAMLTIGGAAVIGGCQDNSNLPPGENGSRAGGNGAFGSDTVQPGEGMHNMNGTDPNAAPTTAPAMR